jgi:hypothetical protein
MIQRSERIRRHDAIRPNAISDPFEFRSEECRLNRNDYSEACDSVDVDPVKDGSVFDTELPGGGAGCHQVLVQIDDRPVGSIPDRVERDHPSHSERCFGKKAIRSIEPHGAELIRTVRERGVHRRRVATEAAVGESFVSGPAEPITGSVQAMGRSTEIIDAMSDDEPVDVDREPVGDGDHRDNFISETGPRSVAESEHRSDGCDSETGQTGQRIE